MTLKNGTGMKLTSLPTILCLLLFASSSCLAQTSPPKPASPGQKEKTLTMHAKGPFEVKLAPQDSPDLPQGVLSRMSIDKQFHGDLEGTSKGEMLIGGTDVKGSAGYVAMEQVVGKLNGRSGSFILQHSATMNRGVPQLSITVVPDSGTGQLAGLTGSMNIIITDGKHAYDFEYSLPEAH
jgi:hypothetical protein